MSGRYEKLLGVFLAQMKVRRSAFRDGGALPFTDAEFGALIRSPHPDAMKLLANGLARGVDKKAAIRPPMKGA